MPEAQYPYIIHQALFMRVSITEIPKDKKILKLNIIETLLYLLIINLSLSSTNPYTKYK